jgi:hypothetical protein
VVDPLACDGRLQIAGLHISPPGQLRHQGYPNTQPLPPLMFKQPALDFGQWQDRWHDEILSATAPRQIRPISDVGLLSGCSQARVIELFKMDHENPVD